MDFESTVCKEGRAFCSAGAESQLKQKYTRTTEEKKHSTRRRNKVPNMFKNRENSKIAKETTESHTQRLHTKTEIKKKK